MIFYDLNFFAFLAAFMASLSPEAILSAPIFFPFVGQPYFSFFLNTEHPENIQRQTSATNIFFIKHLLYT